MQIQYYLNTTGKEKKKNILKHENAKVMQHPWTFLFQAKQDLVPNK